ncbi:hypothetical protein AVEN_95018-1 [Araneus ventricosus]|uniref:Uncharacterized protein n=1 Tax=Araneus ventricosus TaxID=182803 RepID=A0A4Y2GWE5_ARAVE|nr:hypothetical protein AVEN_95018-1 [Araneus ventricosus]
MTTWVTKNPYYSPDDTYTHYATDYGDKRLVRLCLFLKQNMMMRYEDNTIFQEPFTLARPLMTTWVIKNPYYSPDDTDTHYATDYGDKRLVRLCLFLKQNMMMRHEDNTILH